MAILGIDEVGRGCLAGPLVVGAVLLDDDIPDLKLKDSKLLSAKQRQDLLSQIKRVALAYGLGWASSQEIDKLGLTDATKLAAHRAVEHIKIGYDKIIIDGTINLFKDDPLSQTLIKADNLIPAVSAASILAKCARDGYMHGLVKQYPEYGFDKHVGYATRDHLAALKLNGPCAIHRLSFKPVADLVRAVTV